MWMHLFFKQQDQSHCLGFVLEREPLPVSDILFKDYPPFLEVRSAGCLRGQSQLGPGP